MYFLRKFGSSFKDKKRVVLVGNAPIKTNVFNKKFLPGFIDDSEVVIRINSADNYSKGTGEKSDILGVINIGEPAIQFSYRKRINKYVKKDISSLWFSRPLNLYDSAEIEILAQEELSKHILSFQELNHIPFHAISKEKYQSISKMVSPADGGDIYDPSTGLCILYMMLSAEEFIGLKKYIVGFTWEGWAGHNWEVEKKICLDLHQQGEICIL